MRVIRRAASLVLAAALWAAPALAAGAQDPVEQQYAQEDTANYFQAYNEPIDREGFCYLVVSLMAELEETTVDQLYARLTDAQKEEAFDDVTDENKYISLAKKYELVVGSGMGAFSPQADAQRQEVAAILVNFIRRMAPQHWDESRDYTQDVVIEDRVEIDDWARQAVAYMVQCGLMPLDENQNFDPTGTMTVEEAVLLLSNFRLYLETPADPASGVPAAVWIAGSVGAGAAAVAILIAVLLGRSRAKKRREAEQERRRTEDLAQRLAPAAGRGTSSQAPRSGAVETRLIPPSPENSAGGTVLLEPEPGRPRLRLSDGQSGLDQTFALERPLTVGRLEDNLLCLSDGAVSGHHCRFFWEGGQVLLEDVGARNPIWIQRGADRLAVRRGEPVPVQTGDVLHLGSMRVRVELTGGAGR